MRERAEAASDRTPSVPSLSSPHALRSLRLSLCSRPGSGARSGGAFGFVAHFGAGVEFADDVGGQGGGIGLGAETLQRKRAEEQVRQRADDVVVLLRIEMVDAV